MKNLQKMGGIAALYEAAAYLLGFALWIGVLNYSGDLTPAEKVASFVNNQTMWYLLNLVVYIGAGFFLVVLAVCTLRTSEDQCIRNYADSYRHRVDLGWRGHCQRHDRKYWHRECCQSL